MEEKYLVPLALLSHESLSTVLLWRFVVVGNNKTYLILHVNWPILTKFGRLKKKSPLLSLMEVQPLGARQIRADKQLMTKLTVALAICAKAPKNSVTQRPNN